VHLDGVSRDYSAVADLPNQKFKTTYIWVDANSGLNDDRLKDMLGLDSLKRLALNDNNRVTDVGIAHLKGLPSLEHLDLRDTRMTNDGLKHLAALNRLEVLVRMGSQFTDEGVGHLEGCTHLRSLQSRLPAVVKCGST
jgi:internalin A